jgi:hypothetical protein
MAKAGKQFELVVSDILKEMPPGATVRQGDWIEGPDGRRELDVFIEGRVDDAVRRVQIECKDYDPRKRPVGIAQIDALDSKHRDLGVDVSLLCTNAGFSDDAVRKARRLGIGLIGILRESDPRVRYKVVDEIYIRRINFDANRSKIYIMWCSNAGSNPIVQELLYLDLPVYNWVLHRVLAFLAQNPIVGGSHTLRFRLKKPLEFTFPAGQAWAKEIIVEVVIEGAWVSQRIEIDGSSGLYDWLRQTIRHGPGAGRVVFKDLKFGEGGKPFVVPPILKGSTLRASNFGSLWSSS